MELREYINDCKRTLEKLEINQDYEVCQELHELIGALERRDVKAYIHLAFPVKELRKAKFFKPRATWQEMEQRIIGRLGLESIFDYSTKSQLGCPYDNYLRFGRWGVYPGVVLNEASRSSI